MSSIKGIDIAVLATAVVVFITLIPISLTYLITVKLNMCNADFGSPCCNRRVMDYFVTKEPSLWHYLRRKVTEIPKVLTIGGII
jgi:hypothetical protein